MILNYLKAANPALLIVTSEPQRVPQAIMCTGWSYLIWDCLNGISDADTLRVLEEIRDPVEAVRYLDQCRDTVLIARNLHLYFQVPEIIEALNSGVVKWKSTGCCLVVVSPIISLRPEIEKLFTIIDLPLPDDQALYELQQEIGRDCGISPNRKAALAARGLTELESETAFALSAVQANSFDSRIIDQAKAQLLRKSGLLEFWPPADINEVGGLASLKSFISNRKKAFEPGNEHLPRMKAILLLGIPGTGKSLYCKATASLLGWPLIRLDISSLKNSLVGESERRMREALKIIDAFGNAVVWCDEIDKAFAGVGSNNDSGTSYAMFGTFLTWMQETTSPVLVMATANDVSRLPPEILRAGRFDAVMFVDLPTASEREEIIRIVNKKIGSDIPLSFSDKLAGWTGAEILQLGKDSLYEELEQAYQAIVPLSKTMREEISSLRDWARTRARPANTPEPESKTNRKVRRPKVFTKQGPTNPLLN